VRFLLEHNERQKCWKIYDMRKHRQIEEPPMLMSIGDSMMDDLLAGYLIAQGAIEVDGADKKQRYVI
jgi:hypothetical protein